MRNGEVMPKVTRDIPVQFYVSAEEVRLLERMADPDDRTMSSWLRTVIKREAAARGMVLPAALHEAGEGPARGL